ncbi:MAG: rod shape-determining protein MreD [Gaiellales bacterium]
MILALRLVPLVLVAALLQVSAIGGAELLWGELDVLLLVVIAVALLRGSLVGAGVGFAGGLLVDVMSLSTLGVNSLLLTLVGYWAGRYGETTGRGRSYAPPLAAFVLTLLLGLAAAILHFLLGDAVPAGAAFGPLLPTAALCALLVLPVRRLCRSLVGEPALGDRAREVDLV